MWIFINTINHTVNCLTYLNRYDGMTTRGCSPAAVCSRGQTRDCVRYEPSGAVARHNVVVHHQNALSVCRCWYCCKDDLDVSSDLIFSWRVERGLLMASYLDCTSYAHQTGLQGWHRTRLYHQLYISSWELTPMSQRWCRRSASVVLLLMRPTYTAVTPCAPERSPAACILNWFSGAEPTISLKEGGVGIPPSIPVHS